MIYLQRSRRRKVGDAKYCVSTVSETNIQYVKELIISYLQLYFK